MLQDLKVQVRSSNAGENQNGFKTDVEPSNCFFKVLDKDTWFLK